MAGDPPSLSRDHSQRCRPRTAPEPVRGPFYSYLLHLKNQFDQVNDLLSITFELESS